jgi:hypothetical protein
MFSDLILFKPCAVDLNGGGEAKYVYVEIIHYPILIGNMG